MVREPLLDRYLREMTRKKLHHSVRELIAAVVLPEVCCRKIRQYLSLSTEAESLPP